MIMEHQPFMSVSMTSNDFDIQFIDEDIRKEILGLRQSGVNTLFCCSGHAHKKKHKRKAYVCFDYSPELLSIIARVWSTFSMFLPFNKIGIYLDSLVGHKSVISVHLQVQNEKDTYTFKIMLRYITYLYNKIFKQNTE